MTDIKVDAFLEHFGVKGMKWGVRKSPSARRLAKEKKYGPKDRKKRTATQKRHRSERNVERLGRAALVVSGGLYAVSLISALKQTGPSAQGRPRMSDYSKPSSSVQDTINKARKIKVDAIDKTFREGFIDKAQRDQFVKKMNTRYDRKLADALKNK